MALLEKHTQLGNTLSDISWIHKGIPQGTVLSPNSLYNVLSTLSSLPLNGNIYSYADDTAILISYATWQLTWHKAESDMTLLDDWFFSNNLRINYNKSKFIAFLNETRTASEKKKSSFIIQIAFQKYVLVLNFLSIQMWNTWDY